MRHRVEFREITPEDIDLHCRFMPDDGEFEVHLAAMTQDTELMEGVTGVYRDGFNSIVLVTEEALEVTKEKLIPLLQNHWAYLRCSRICSLDEN